jgi:hypothetical protein
MPAKYAGLSDKHKKAINALVNGDTVKQAAKKSGLSEDQLYSLKEGQAKAGSISSLFKSELDRLTVKQFEKVKNLTKATQRLALEKVQQFLLDRAGEKPDAELVKQCTTILNSIGKITPNVEIGEFHTHTHLSGEELVSEFQRLKDEARSALAIGRRISSPE